MRGGDAGVTVEDNFVGAQHVIVLPSFHRSVRDHQPVLAVVIDLIGGEGHRRILRTRTAAGRGSRHPQLRLGGGRAQQRHGDAAGKKATFWGAADHG